MPMRALALALTFALFGCPGGPHDVTLAPPAAGKGFQLATPAWDVPARSEQQRCYFFRVPASDAGATDLWVSRLTLAQNPGSHHFNVFRVKTIVNLDGEDGDLVDGGECWKSSNWADWPLVINSQQSVAGEIIDWTLPTGVAHHFTPGEKLMLQTHYVNGATQSTPGRAKAIVNFQLIDPGSPTPQELGTVFATNQNIKVCPGDTDRTYAATCRFARGSAVTVLAANGHFHSRGVKFTMTGVDGQNAPLTQAPFYTSTQWSDPVWVNDLTVAIPVSGGINWTCSYTMAPDQCGDPANSCCATFGPKVDLNEHCNAFVYYFPKQADATCF